MTIFSWAWIGMAVLFLVIEGVALVVKDRPNRPATLSSHIWWLIQGVGIWHQLARVALVAGLAALTTHLLQ